MPPQEQLIERGEGVAEESGTPSPAQTLSPAQMMAVLSYRLPYLYRYAYRLLGNKADAEDAAQDALLAAFKHLSQFRGEAQLSTWLTAIIINCVRMQVRKRSRYIHVSLESRIGEEQKHPLSDILVDGRPNPEDECHRSTLNARLIKSAAQLSPTDETARVLGVPTGTVKAQTARARAKLMNSIRGTLHKGSRSGGRRR